MSEKYGDIRCLHANPHLNFYHMDAIADSGRVFDYYFASRNDAAHIKAKSGELTAEGVVMYPLLKDDPDHILLIRQYRYPVGAWLYELPAGLIEPGETPAEAAVRELKEETGYLFTPIPTDPAFSRPFYMGAGYTDEACVAVFGWADGANARSKPEDTESIELHIADKAEMRRILREERVSLRLAYLSLLFLNNHPEDPFGFVGG